MSILNIVECESYEIKVKSPNVELSSVDIIDECWKQGSHNPIQLGGEFDTYEQAVEYAKECAKHDYPTCQRLMHGGYAICGNIYMAESTDMEDGEVMDYLDSEYITQPYKGDK